MITVAGLNTSLDRFVELNAALAPGVVQRAKEGSELPGGKGVHVAQTIAALGEPVRLVGITDASHGSRIASYLRERRVEWHGVEVPGDVRQCVALREPSGRMTEVLESGPTLDAESQARLVGAVRQWSAGSNVLVLSGSAPKGLPDATYAKLVQEAAAVGIKCLVDASGDALRYAVEAKPWLVKPNADEAAALTGRSIRGIDDALACARELRARGAANVVITLGAKGAVAFDGSSAWRAWSDPIEVRNSVGSGDCFMAALAIGAARGASLQDALPRAVACGAANAASVETGYADAARVAAWLAHVHVTAVPRESP